MARTKTKSQSKYTKPKLREEIKESIQDSDKGGPAGRWSARKSQLLVNEYERAGGGYTTGRKDESARSLERWTEQDWQTIEGDSDARRGGTTKRYLPRQVWQALSDDERREAERTKTTRSHAGKHRVPWTPAIKRAFAQLEGGEDGSARSGSTPTRKDLYERARQLNIPGRSRMTRDQLREAIDRAS